MHPALVVLVGFGALTMSSCTSSLGAYHCQENSDCQTEGQSGATCESNDLCSFSDPECGLDGQRYGSSSGELSNECVSTVAPDAAAPDAPAPRPADAAGPVPPTLVDAGPPDADVSCYGEAPILIELGVPIQGSTSTGINNDSTCDRTDGPEVYHRIDLSPSQVPATLVVTTDLPGTTSDTVLRVWTECDLTMGSELVCFDGGNGETRNVPVTLPGSYFVVVDSHAGLSSGSYELLVTLE